MVETRLERWTMQVLGPAIGAWYEAYLNTRDLALIGVATLRGRLKTVRTVGELNPDKVAIVTSAGRGNVPRSIDNLVRMLKDQGCCILLVYNGRLNDATKQRLAPFLWQTFERPNIGRDFAAYQAGVQYLASQNIFPKRLLVANDSMYYDLNRAPDMLRRALESPSHFVGITESHDPVYHIGSFFFVVSDTVQKSKAWVKYWRTYWPSSARPHVIRYGELGMSIALIQKGGFQPHILFSTVELGRHIRQWDVNELARNVHLLPKEFRTDIVNVGLHEYFKEGSMISSDLVQLAMKDDPREAIDLLQGASALSAKKIRLTSVIEALIEKIEMRSQIHWGGALMLKYLDIGFVKKDFAIRGLYNINDFIQMMDELGYPDMEEVNLETRKRGLPISLKGIRRVLYDLGYV